MQPYARAPDLVWPGHLHGTGCLGARAVGTGFPTVGLRLWLGPGCGWLWVLFTPARCGWGLGWVCLGSVCGVVPLLLAVCGVRGWALVSACFRDLCGFLRVSLAPRRFRFRCAVWACVLGPGLGCATPFLAGLSGCVFCAFSCFFFSGCWVSLSRALWSLPPSPFFRAGLLAFFFFFFCLFRCPFSRWAAVPGLVLPFFGLVVPLCLFGGPVFGALWVGGLAPFRVVGGRFGGFGLFSRGPAPSPPFFFSGGGGAAWLFPPLPSLGWRLPCGWCVVWLVPRHSWRRFLCATPRHSCLGFAAGGGGRSPPLLAGVCRRRWCLVCCGGVLVGLWLVCGVVGPSPLLAEVPVCYSPPLLAGFRCWWWWAVPATPGWGPLAAVVCGVWCVVCGGGVLVGLWLVCGVVGPSPLLAEVPVCYSPPLLPGFRCRWWWAVPATPGWGLPAAVVSGVWRWCVGGVVAGVWCGWSLATPGGGSCVLLPATPGWVSLPVVVGGPRHSWLGSVSGVAVWCVVCGGGVLVGLWLVCGVVGPSPLLAEVPVCYSPPLLAGFRCRWWWAVPATPGWGPLAAVVCGVWCVVCGGGVLVGLWLVCGVVGPSPLLAEVPVCYSEPLLAGFRCRWWWAVPATPGWGSLAALLCGVWCVVVVCWWGCGWCVVWLVPRHSWRRFLCATPRHSWLVFAAGGGGRSPPLLAGVRLRRWCVVCGVWCVAVVCWWGCGLVSGVVGPSPLLAEVPVCYSPPLLAGFCCRWWWAVPATPGWGRLGASVSGVWRWYVVGVVVGVWRGWSLATPGGGPCVLLPATPGWVSLPVVVCGPRHSWLGSVGGAGVWCVVCGVLLGSLATPGGGSCVLLPATPGWVSLPLVVGGPRHSWLGSAGGGGVRALLGRVGRAGLPGAFWCASSFPLAALSFCFAWPPPGWGCPSLFCCCCPSALVVFLGLLLPGSRLVCVSRLAVDCSLVVAPPPPPPLCVSRFSSLLLVALVFFFFFLFSFLFFLRAPPLSPAFSGFRPRVPWASALALFVLLVLRFSALRALVPLSCFPPGCCLLPRGCCPPPPPLCLAVFVPAARCCVPCCAVRPWVRCCAALLRVVSPGVVLSCAVLRSFGAAACCAVSSGVARRPGALCSAALCFAVFPRGVCSVLRVLSWRGGACCCSPLCLVLCVSRGAVLCVPCALRSVRCCDSLCWCARVVLFVWCVLLLAPGAVVRCCVLRCFLWCAVVRCWVWWPVVVCWWRVSVSLSLSGRVVCFPVVGVVCCGALLSCVVFCGAVLSRGPTPPRKQNRQQGATERHHKAGEHRGTEGTAQGSGTPQHTAAHSGAVLTTQLNCSTG